MTVVDYEHAVLDPADDSEANRIRMRGWLDAVSRGFHDPRWGDDGWEVHLRASQADAAVLQGYWLPEGSYGAGRMPVATFAHYDFDLHTGTGLLPTRMITDITVSPAHRRRGLLRRMMEPVLADAVAQGVPTACLTVSEATIYGRFGFGPATFARHIELDTHRGIVVEGPADPGHVEVVEPRTAWTTMDGVFQRFHATTRGSVHRPAFYEPWLTGSFDFDGGGEERKSHLAVHLDADGSPDGYALYKHEGHDERPQKVRVRTLVALTPGVELALWRFLSGIDLSGRLLWSGARDDDGLQWALQDRDRYTVTKRRDHIWLRVLDVPVALSARPWYADGRVVVEVHDAQGHAAGRWSVEAAGGVAEVTRTGDEPDATMSADVLGALYLGGTAVGTLARAGRVTGAGVDRLAGVADGGPTPYSVTSF